MRSVIPLVAVALAFAMAPAAAHDRSYRHHRGYYDQGYAREYSQAPRGYCQPLCSFDMSPCDPPEYKSADNRCGNPVAGVPAL